MFRAAPSGPARHDNHPEQSQDGTDHVTQSLHGSGRHGYGDGDGVVEVGDGADSCGVGVFPHVVDRFQGDAVGLLLGARGQREPCGRAVDDDLDVVAQGKGDCLRVRPSTRP